RASSTDDKGTVFSSAATYRANGNGEIDLKRDPSLSGRYVGVEPMGLLWSMTPDSLHKRLQKINALNPFMVKFSVHEETGEGRILAEATNERILMGDGVIRVPVKEGNIRGVLFTPPGRGPFPSVLDLYTYGGGLSEKRASLLASRGFLVLTVALYGHDDLPKNVKEIHLDYLEEAVEFLKKQTKGSSKKVVWINGCSANVVLPFYYKKRQIHSALMFDLKKAIPTESGAFITKYVLNNPLAEENKGSLIPIEQAKGHFLFVASEDDLCWDSKAYMDQMVERLKRHGKEKFESVSYPGAGHYLEPPYGPYCRSSFNVVLGKPALWGGEPKSHAAAEVHMWKKIQDFLRNHLSSDAAQNRAKL
uniref:Acyl-coenzyme A thioesterase 5-like n=1 Tax=Neolamprologus brichardi TaxID=32507 RepID=A0A3Q4G2U9_NEOBR